MLFIFFFCDVWHRPHGNILWLMPRTFFFNFVNFPKLIFSIIHFLLTVWYMSKYVIWMFGTLPPSVVYRSAWLRCAICSGLWHTGAHHADSCREPYRVGRIILFGTIYVKRNPDTHLPYTKMTQAIIQIRLDSLCHTRDWGKTRLLKKGCKAHASIIAQL